MAPQTRGNNNRKSVGRTPRALVNNGERQSSSANVENEQVAHQEANEQVARQEANEHQQVLDINNVQDEQRIREQQMLSASIQEEQRKLQQIEADRRLAEEMHQRQVAANEAMERCLRETEARYLNTFGGPHPIGSSEVNSQRNVTNSQQSSTVEVNRIQPTITAPVLSSINPINPSMSNDENATDLFKKPFKPKEVTQMMHTKITIFKGTDLVNWKTEIERLFTIYGVLVYLKKDMVSIYPSNESVKVLDQQLSLVLDSYIDQSIKNSLRKTANSTYQTYTAIGNWYSLEEVDRRAEALSKLRTCRIKSNNIEEYTRDFHSVLMELQRMEITADEICKQYFLDGLGTEGELCRVQVNTHDNKASTKLDCKEAIEFVHSIYQRKTANSNDLHSRVNNNTSEPNANGDVQNNQSVNFSNNGNRRVDRFSARSGRSYGRFQRNNHGRRNNQRSTNQDRNQHRSNSNGSNNRNGAVYISRNNTQANGNPVPRMNDQERRRYRNYQCNICGRYGHIARFCPQSRDDNSTNNHANYNQQDSTNHHDEDVTGCVFSNQISKQVIDNGSVCNTVLKDLWIFDTGTSIHISNDKKWFVDLRPCTAKFKTSNEGSYLYAEAIGTVKLTMQNNEVLFIDDVYLCPNASLNLLTNLGLNSQIKFEVNHQNVFIMYRKKPGRYIKYVFARACGNQNIIQLNKKMYVNSLYKTRSSTKQNASTLSQESNNNENISAKRGRGRPRKQPVTSESHSTSDGSENDFVKNNDELFFDEQYLFDEDQPFADQPINHSGTKESVYEVWKLAAARSGVKTAKDVHLYQGHSGINATKQMCKLLGIEYKEVNCTVCQTMNLKQLSTSSSLNKTTRPLQIVYMDLVQIFGQSPSFDGYKYSLTILDDYTGMCFTYNLFEKTEVLKFVKIYIAQAERRHNTKVVELRTDNGTEFVNNEFKDFVLSSGIEHNLIVPYVHFQNGSIERLNRTIQDKALKLIRASGLSSTYWSEAMLLSTYFYNRSITSDGKIPFAEWYSRVDDRKLFQFGERVVYLKPSANTSKNAEYMQRTGTFVGYARSRKAYRVLTDENNKVIYDVARIKALKDEEVNLRSQYVCCSLEGANKEDFESSTDDSQQSKPEMQSHQQDEMKIPNFYGDISKLPIEQQSTWNQAVTGELKSMTDQNVFQLIRRDQATTSIIDTRYVFTVKEGTAKARLVARGDHQHFDNFNETFSPTMNSTLLKILLKIALGKGLKVYCYDVKRAFLNANLEEDVYINIPDGYEANYGEIDKEQYCIKLNKALYGLRQASRAWYLEIKQKLIDFGFGPVEREPTVFKHKTIEDFYVAVYVDDLIVLHRDFKVIDNLYSYLSKFYELHQRGEIERILGLNVRKLDNCYKISLEDMIQQVASKHNVQPNRFATTPLPPNDIVLKAENSTAVDQKKYMSLIGSLLYISRMVRHDILTAVTMLTQFQREPKAYHLKKARHVIQYLLNTIDYELVIKRENLDELVLNVYSDSSLGNAHDGKSFMGCCVMYGNTMVHCFSRKTSTVCISANESEINASSESIKELLYYSYVICSLLHGFSSDEECSRCKTPRLLIDNTGALIFINNGYSKRNRYIALRHAAVEDYVEKNKLVLDYVRSESNYADMFTKNLKSSDLKQFCLDIGIDN